MNNLREWLKKNESYALYGSFLLALLILWPIIGWEHMTDNLLSFYSGKHADEKFIAAWVTFAVIFIVELIKDGNWKISSNPLKCVAGLILAYYIYHYAKDGLDLGKNYDNWFTDSIAVFANLLSKIPGWLPDWFYADGWMYSWLIVKSILIFILKLMFVYVFPSFVLSIPLYLLYELWHMWKDQPSNLYEMVGVLVIYPIFFYLSLWITYNYPAYDDPLSRSIYLICASVVLLLMAGNRHRCPECGSSKKELLERGSVRDPEQHVGYTEYYKVYSTGYKEHERTTQNYTQTTHHNSLYRCKRCHHSWWESYTSKSKYER